MIYQLKNDQLKALTESMDIFLKVNGVKVVYQILDLMNLFSNPLSNDNNILKFEVEDNYLSLINVILDLVLKQHGLTVVYGIIDLMEVFKNPILENKIETIENIETDDEV